jgi:hypothetical protein
MAEAFHPFAGLGRTEIDEQLLAFWIGHVDSAVFISRL